MLGLELVQSFTGIEKYLYAISWSADGATLAATGSRGQVGIWTRAAAELRLLMGHSTTVMTLSWHPALPLLATGSDDKTVRLWKTETGQSSILCELRSEIRGVAWAPEGRRLAVYQLDGSLSIYDIEDRAVLRVASPYAPGGYGLSWSRDGSILVAGSEGAEIIVYSGEDLRLIHRLKGHSGPMATVALTPQGDVIASAGEDCTVRIWDSASGKEVAILEGHRGILMCIGFSPDGEFLASLSPEELRLWRRRDWECVSTVPRADAIAVGGLDFHPSQPFLAAKDMPAESPDNKSEPRVDCFKIDYALLGGANLMPDSSRYYMSTPR